MSRTGIALFITVIIVICIYMHFGKSNENKQKAASAIQHTFSRDNYGLLASDYDKNGWAKVNGKWVSNPRKDALIKYSLDQDTVTVSNTVSTSKSNQNLTSIEGIYPILQRVANELQYSDIPALQDSFKNMKPLYQNQYYTYQGRKFYSQQSLMDYKLQQARDWGGKNDQNGDGVINCQDYAELFYKYAKSEGFNVRYITNSGLNHAFNSVKINDAWYSIEPQAAENGLSKKPYLINSFPEYNPAYDTVKK